MTDVETKTPNKRRFSEKGDKKGPASAKKAKVSPQPQGKVLNKQNNVQNNKKPQKKNKTNSESENGSPKKLKPFGGTAKIEKPNKKQEKGKDAQPGQEKSGTKKRRNNLFTVLRSKLESNEKEATIKQIDEKIKAIESRDEITKTAKRRLKQLHKIKRVALGETAPQQQNVAKAGQKKGAPAAKALQTNASKKLAAKPQAKGAQKKANDVNQKQAKVAGKPATKKEKQLVIEESSDDDEESEDEDAGEEVEEEEEDGVEGEDSGDEEESGEEEEDSDEDDSEEDVSPPPPQVSNKKLKKK